MPSFSRNECQRRDKLCTANLILCNTLIQSWVCRKQKRILVLQWNQICVVFLCPPLALFPGITAKFSNTLLLNVKAIPEEFLEYLTTERNLHLTYLSASSFVILPNVNSIHLYMNISTWTFHTGKKWLVKFVNIKNSNYPNKIGQDWSPPTHPKTFAVDGKLIIGTFWQRRNFWGWYSEWTLDLPTHFLLLLGFFYLSSS